MPKFLKNKTRNVILWTHECHPTHRVLLIFIIMASFGTTLLVHLRRNTLQDDTFNIYLFSYSSNCPFEASIKNKSWQQIECTLTPINSCANFKRLFSILVPINLSNCKRKLKNWNVS